MLFHMGMSRSLYANTSEVASALRRLKLFYLSLASIMPHSVSFFRSFSAIWSEYEWWFLEFLKPSFHFPRQQADDMDRPIGRYLVMSRLHKINETLD